MGVNEIVIIYNDKPIRQSNSNGYFCLTDILKALEYDWKFSLIEYLFSVDGMEYLHAMENHYNLKIHDIIMEFPNEEWVHPIYAIGMMRHIPARLAIAINRRAFNYA